MNRILGWPLLFAGQFLFVFSLVALSGPGRIDIVDGQTRFEVGRSLVEHGDSVIRDDRVWFMIFDGRDSQRYTIYRFPQSLAAAGAIVVADATGPVEEGRRHFLFTLTGAVACGLLAAAFAVWFRRLGFAPGRVLLWSSLGIFATPCWFYGTSTFDDILGTCAVVSALVISQTGGQRQSVLAGAVAGLLLGLAFNCKEPLGVFVLPVLAAFYQPRAELDWLRVAHFRPRAPMALVVAGLVVGVAVYQAYDFAKFPAETRSAIADEFQNKYVPIWTSNPIPGLLGLTISPGAGALWYCPPLLLGLWGLWRWRSVNRWLVRATLAAMAIFVVFLSFITYFAGDPTWGPRYLTPVFAILWLYAPVGAQGRSPLLVKGLIGLGILVQLLGLSVDPHRLYTSRNLESAFYYHRSPWLYFDRDVAHLLNRPREIAEIVTGKNGVSAEFTPSPSPTFAFPVIDFVGTSDEPRPTAIRKYHILNSLRPWWISQQYLTPQERPVDLLPTVLFLAGLTAAGTSLAGAGYKLLRTNSGSILNVERTRMSAPLDLKHRFRVMP